MSSLFLAIQTPELHKHDGVKNIFAESTRPTRTESGDQTHGHKAGWPVESIICLIVFYLASQAFVIVANPQIKSKTGNLLPFHSKIISHEVPATWLHQYDLGNIIATSI